MRRNANEYRPLLGDMGEFWLVVAMILLQIVAMLMTPVSVVKVVDAAVQEPTPCE